MPDPSYEKAYKLLDAAAAESGYDIKPHELNDAARVVGDLGFSLVPAEAGLPIQPLAKMVRVLEAHTELRDEVILLAHPDEQLTGFTGRSSHEAITAGDLRGIVAGIERMPLELAKAILDRRDDFIELGVEALEELLQRNDTPSNEEVAGVVVDAVLT